MRSMVAGSTTPIETARAAQDQIADRQSVIRVDELGVVDAEERRLAIENDARRHHRAGQASAADLIGAGDTAETKIAEPALDR